MYKIILLALILSLNIYAGRKNKNKNNHSDFKSTTLTFHLDEESRKGFKEVPNPKIFIAWLSGYLYANIELNNDTNFTFDLYPITKINDSLFSITISEAPDKKYLDPSISSETAKLFDSLSEEQANEQIISILNSIHDTTTSLYAISSVILMNDGNNDDKLAVKDFMSEDVSDPKKDWQAGVVEDYGIIYSSDQKALDYLLEFRNDPDTFGKTPCLWEITKTDLTVVKGVQCENVTFDGAKEVDIKNIPIKVGKDFKYTNCNWN